ncbi:MAG: radical SAM protein [Clostridium sp.]
MHKRTVIIPVFISHQGCPHQCVFCNQDRIAGKADEIREKQVREIIEEYLTTIDSNKCIIEVSFFGGTFTAIPVELQKELLSVAHEYKLKGKIHKIRMSTRPDAINKYILDYLKEYTVDIIELGVQSLNDEILKMAGRGHSVYDVEKSSELIREYGITLGHQIMPGLPGDTLEIDLETCKKSISLKPDIVRIYPALVIKDTPMEVMHSRGEYVPYTLEEAIDASKMMVKLYTDAGVNVIRVGLQGTDTIALGKDVVDGPFHPAFRELVESNLIIDNILSRVSQEKHICIEINSKDLSKLYANKKQYFNSLCEVRTGKTEVLINDKIKRGTFKISIIEESFTFKV